MKHDIGSGYELTVSLNSQDVDAGTAYTASVDMSTAVGVTFAIMITAVATLLTLTLQYSDDDITFVDEPDTLAGNDISVTKDNELGLVQINCPNPRERYVRLKMVSTGADAGLSIVSIAGPLLYVDAPSAI